LRIIAVLAVVREILADYPSHIMLGWLTSAVFSAAALPYKSGLWLAKVLRFLEISSPVAKEV
jgi:hypothetical protein